MKNDYFKTNFEKYDKPISNLNSKDCEDWAPSKLMSVFSRYTQNSYFEQINNALRSGYTESILVNDDIEALDKLFKLVPNKLKNKTPMTVYRGALLTKELDDILQGKSKTDIYTEKAFVSTSKSKQVAKQFAMYGDKIILEIELPQNTTFIEDSMLPSHARSRMSSEEEVLLPRNAQFKITGFDPKTRIVKAIYLGQKQPLEMPEIFEYSGSDMLSNLNKNLLIIDKEPMKNNIHKKDINE
ncbi:hypothetical protein IJD15_01180 [bacterium]|nr:hypothetical protein [bacterium]